MDLALAERRFLHRFGRAPESMAVAPGRVNLLGEHVDYADGIVLPIAIERATCVAVCRGSTGGRSLVRSAAMSGSSAEIAFDAADPTQPAFRDDAAWANYVVGPLRELWASRAARSAEPLELLIDVTSEIPLGAGVSSSAAIEVATIVALADLEGLDLLADAASRTDIARIAQRAEHRWAGVPCGIMDMMASVHARQGHALRIDCRSLDVRPVPIPADIAILVVDSGVRHRLSDGGYAARRKDVVDAAAELGVPSLRDATQAAIDASGRRADDQDARRRHRRARHVVAEIARVDAFAAALESSDRRALRELLAAGHASLRDDFDVSVPEIEELVAAALDAPGAIGARLTGGGFGGSVVVLVERDAVDAVGGSIAQSFARRFGRAPSWFATSAADGARIVRSAHRGR